MYKILFAVALFATSQASAVHLYLVNATNTQIDADFEMQSGPNLRFVVQASTSLVIPAIALPDSVRLATVSYPSNIRTLSATQLHSFDTASSADVAWIAILGSPSGFTSSLVQHDTRELDPPREITVDLLIGIIATGFGVIVIPLTLLMAIRAIKRGINLGWGGSL